MTLFYFNISNSDEVEDREGCEFPSLGEAVRAATQSARGIVVDQIKSGQSLDLEQRIKILDENHDLVHEVTFEDAMLNG